MRDPASCCSWAQERGVIDVFTVTAEERQENMNQEWSTKKGGGGQQEGKIKGLLNMETDVWSLFKQVIWVIQSNMMFGRSSRKVFRTVDGAVRLLWLAPAQLEHAGHIKPSASSSASLSAHQSHSSVRLPSLRASSYTLASQSYIFKDDGSPCPSWRASKGKECVDKPLWGRKN